MAQLQSLGWKFLYVLCQPQVKISYFCVLFEFQTKWFSGPLFLWPTTPPFQQRLEIVSGIRWGFFNWPVQNLLKFGQIINIWKIHSANFLHIKKLKFQKTLPPQACVYCSLNHMWPLSQQAREYPGSCLWSETSILLARERQEPMPEWRSSCPACLFCMWPPATTQEIWGKEEFKKQVWRKIRSRNRSASLVRRNLSVNQSFCLGVTTRIGL